MKKQTSDRVSRIAARVMGRCGERGRYGKHVYIYFRGDSGFRAVCTRSELLSLAASCLSQDETKGRRPKRRRK